MYSRVFGKIHVFQRFCTCISACAPSTVLRVASRPARPLYMYKILYMHGIRSASSGMSIRYLRVEYDSTRYFLCCCATRLSVFEFRCGTFTDPLQQPLLLKLRSLYLVKVYIYEIDMHVWSIITELVYTCIPRLKRQALKVYLFRIRTPKFTGYSSTCIIMYRLADCVSLCKLQHARRPRDNFKTTTCTNPIRTRYVWTLLI